MHNGSGTSSSNKANQYFEPYVKRFRNDLRLKLEMLYMGSNVDKLFYRIVRKHITGIIPKAGNNKKAVYRFMKAPIQWL